MTYPVFYIIRDLQFNTLYKDTSQAKAERFALNYCKKRSESENRNKPIFLVKTQLLKAFPEYQNDMI